MYVEINNYTLDINNTFILSLLIMACTRWPLVQAPLAAILLSGECFSLSASNLSR